MNNTESDKIIITPELFESKAANLLGIMAITKDARQRAEDFSALMDQAREYNIEGFESRIYDLAQNIAREYKTPEFWEIPKPFEKDVTLEPFPVNALPEVCADYLTEVCKNTQVSSSMGALLLLSVLSLCVQGKAVIRNPGGGNIETLNLYTLTIAAPGERKSGIFKALTAPLYQYQKEENQRREPIINEYKLKKKLLEKEYETALKGSKKDPDMAKKISQELDELTPVYPLNLNVTDTTPEAIAVEMTKNDEKIGILNDEGGIFDILSGLYSSGTPNIDLFLKAYDGSYYNICRIGRNSINLENPLITFGLMTQSEAFQKAMQNPQFSGRGFVHRFLFSFPESKAGNRTFTSNFVSSAIRDNYKMLINRLLDLKTTEPITIECDKEAFYIFKDYHDYIERNLNEGGIFEYIQEWANKQLGRALRIAGILHLCENEPTEKLNGDTALDAVSIAMWCDNQALKAFGEIAANEEYKDAKYVWGKIKKKGLLELSRMEINQLCRGKFKSDEMDEPLDTLVSLGYIREAKQEYSGNGRKPLSKYKINPVSLSKDKK